MPDTIDWTDPLLLLVFASPSPRFLLLLLGSVWCGCHLLLFVVVVVLLVPTPHLLSFFPHSISTFTSTQARRPGERPGAGEAGNGQDGWRREDTKPELLRLAWDQHTGATRQQQQHQQ